jgi:hypothetical protein
MRVAQKSHVENQIRFPRQALRVGERKHRNRKPRRRIRGKAPFNHAAQIS